MSLNELTISEAAGKLRAKEIKATELTEACLAAIEAGNKALNAFLVVTADKAMEAAKESDKRLGAKSEAGVRALEGIPLGIKDSYCTKGVRTTACSHILHNFVPAYESTVTQNLWDAGAVMLGKLNMDEFAMGSSNETSYLGRASALGAPRAARRSSCPAGRRAARRRLSRPASALAQRPRIPAARSASRPHSPARSASSPPTAAARAGA